MIYDNSALKPLESDLYIQEWNKVIDMSVELLFQTSGRDIFFTAQGNIDSSQLTMTELCYLTSIRLQAYKANNIFKTDNPNLFTTQYNPNLTKSKVRYVPRNDKPE